MTIQELQKSFRDDAQKLGDFQLLTKTELANGYCDNDEAYEQAKLSNDFPTMYKTEALRSSYFSALMLRYWYKIFEWMQNSSSLRLEPCEFVNWLIEGLNVAFYYRTWRWENEAKVKSGKFIDWKRDSEGNLIPNPYYYVTDPNAPDKIINRCCASMRGKIYQYNNKDKRRVCVQNYSLDAMIDENGDSATSFTGAFVNPEENKVEYLVNEFLLKGQGIEALIIDGIANYDAFKEKKEKRTETVYDDLTDKEIENSYTHVDYSFDPRKLVKHLNLVNQEFMRSFCITYKVEPVFGKNIYDKLKTMNNTKLYNYIKKTLIEVRQNPKLLECLT